MSEWRTYKLGEIAKFQTGKLNSNAAVENGIYPFFTCSPTTLSINSYAFDKEAILLAGNNAEGNFSIKYYKGKFNAYQRTYVIETLNNLCDIKFLFYSLKMCLFRFKHMSQGTSTKFLTAVILNNFEISLPSFEEQQKIASILSSLDDKIEVNRRINEQLEELAQALFKSWFVDFEPFKDGDFVESELGMIPKGWTTISLSKMADYLNGLAMQKFRPLQGEKGLPVLKIKELGQDSCNETSELCSPSLVNEKYIVNDGDVIFSWSGTLLVKIWCGGVCGLNQHLFKVTSEKYPKWFIYLWTKYHLDRFIRIAKDKAVTMGHIKRGELDTSFAIVPNEEKMKEIDGLMAPLIEKIIANNIEIRHLTTLRDTLLPKLMSGEIEV